MRMFLSCNSIAVNNFEIDNDCNRKRKTKCCACYLNLKIKKFEPAFDKIFLIFQLLFRCFFFFDDSSGHKKQFSECLWFHKVNVWRKQIERIFVEISICRCGDLSFRLQT